MNPASDNPFAGASGSGEFSASASCEDTLRLIAQLSAPEGLEERVRAGLRAAPSAASSKARILSWPAAKRLDNAWARSSLARSAAAAAIAAVVIGGGWGISSRVRPAQPARAVTTLPRLAGQGGFASAGAMRTPQTLNGPVVAHPAVERPVTASTAQTKAAPKNPAQTPSHRNKSAEPPVQ